MDAEPQKSCDDDVQKFFATAAVTMFGFWAIVSWGANKDFHKRYMTVSVLTRPSWMKSLFMVQVLRRSHLYLTICHATPLGLALAAYWKDSIVLRAGAVLMFSFYVLMETCHSHSHRDYANMYVMWGTLLLPCVMSKGLALGICVHFIGSSGLAKVVVGSLKDWVSPKTMRGVLKTYGQLDVTAGGPGWPALNQWSVERNIVLVMMSLSTLIFECIAVPAALIMNEKSRPLLALTSVMLHIGIAAAQSFGIGFAFIPNIATYLFGFGNDGCKPMSGDTDWIIAVSVVALSSILVLFRGRLLPEDWPVTPFALFSWSGEQWNVLFERFVNGHTRLVLASTSANSIIGCRVIPKDFDGRHSIPANETIVHDAWEQVIGETLVMAELLPAFEIDGALADSDWEKNGVCTRLARGTERWLQQTRKLVEIDSGKELLYAYVVRLHSDTNIIAEVLS